MSYWQILRPQAGQNLIVDPSFETDLTIYGLSTRWTDVNLSVLPYQDYVWQYRGVYSSVIEPTSNTTAGVYYTTDTMTADAYTFSVYGLFALNVPYQVRFATTAGVTVGSAFTFTGTGTTQRVTVTATLSAAVHRIYIQKNNSASTATFYLDAAQLELGSTATTYIDGDQPGCTWDGQRGVSSSTRSASTTAGGVWLDFEDDLGIIPLEMQGVGMPPLDNVATPYALLPGARFERSLARSRVFTIVCLVPGSTWANMHALREALIARVQPDQTTQQQPIYLRYTGASEPQIIAAHYDGGLEFAQPTGFAETVPLRFVAHDPFWYSERDYGIVASSPGNVSASYTVLRTPDQTWGSWDFDIAGPIYAILDDYDGTWLIGGDFVDAGGVVGADYLVRYNPRTNTYTSLGTFNGIVRGIAKTVTPNDYVVVGDFTTINAATVRRIAEYSGGAWSELGNANASVTSVITTQNYYVVAGTFTTIDGVTRTRIARYDLNTATWGSIGTGLNGTCNVLIADPTTTDAFYAGGAFTTAAGTTVNRVTRYNGTAFVALGVTGVNNTVNAMALTDNGLLYVGGAFTSAGGVTANYIALWTGTGWQALPSGPLSSVTAITLDSDSNIYTAAASGFNGIASALAVYTRGTWLPFRNVYMSSDGINYIFLSKSREYVVLSNTGTGIYFDFPFALTATNVGSAPARMVITSQLGVTNVTTDQTVYLKNTGFSSLIDTRDNQQRIVDPVTLLSKTSAMLPGSDLGIIVLSPGDNSLLFFGNIYWRPRNWSLDV